jgi:hypothetical protein
MCGMGMMRSLRLKDEVADCPEAAGMLEANGLNQPAVGWRRVTIAKSILAAKVQESSGALFTIM